MRRMPATILTLTLSALGLGSAAQAACDTKFMYPTGTFTYQMVSPGGKTQMTNQVRPVPAGVMVKSTAGGTTNETLFRCVGNTMKADLKGTQMGVSNLPAANLWKVGYQWTSGVQITHPSGLGKMQSRSTHKITRLETVTTPAGRFNAYRVESRTVVDLKLPDGQKLPPGVKMPGVGEPSLSTLWFVKGVGLVKMEQPGSGVSMTLTKIGK